MSRILHRSLKVVPEYIVKAEGMTLTLADGRKIIDSSGGAAVSCIGHGNKRVASAIAAQVEQLDYAHSIFTTNAPAEELAELLVGHSPGNLTHAFFTTSGSDAMESSLKLARQYFVEQGEMARDHFISRHQSYHGNNFGTMALSGHPVRRAPYEDVLPTGFGKVSPCYEYRGKRSDESDAQYVRRLQDELDSEFQRIGPHRVIGFVAEPVVGATLGCVPAVPGYLAAMREVCDRYGALLILDEVMCGMGRTGSTHAWEHEGVAPDLQGIAKGLAGGYAPVGALLVSEKVVEVLRQGSGAFVHGHTLQAQAVGCAAAREVQHIIAEEHLLENVRVMGERLRSGLCNLLSEHPYIGDIRGRGLFYGVEIVEDRGSRTPFALSSGISNRIKLAGLENGIAVYPNSGTVDGKRGDHFIVAPAYNATASQIDEIVERIDLTLRAVFRNAAPGRYND